MHVVMGRHGYLFSVISRGLEVFRSDIASTPGPGAYAGYVP
jgi:hypothetical protein